MDFLQPMGDYTVFFEVKHSEPSTVSKKTNTKVTAANVVDKVNAISNEITHSKLKLGGREISHGRSVLVFVAHRAKEVNFTANWETLDKKSDFPVILFEREHLLTRYGPTFEQLCSFILTYSDRNFL